MSDAQVELLKHFVLMCQNNPALLHEPKMAFYKKYLESLGASIPAPPKTTNASDEQPNKSTKEQSESKQQFKEEEPEEELPLPELDEDGVIQPEEDEPLPQGEESKQRLQISEQDLEKANELRDAGAAAFSAGDYSSALNHYTQAIQANPGSSILFAKRANVLLKLQKPMAAIRDCDKAIFINPDSAQGYKFRGRANRLMGKWVEAHKDLAVACKLDYDETANEWLKEVEPNAKKLHDYQRAKERKVEEKELRERRERIERAREANKRAAESSAGEHDFGSEEGEGESGFGMGGFTELFKELADDPEMLQMLKNDPSLIMKLTEIMQNPQNIMKHMGDPAVKKLIGKLGSRFGAGGSPFGNGFSEENSSADTGTAQPESTFAANKAPEPDLD